LQNENDQIKAELSKRVEQLKGMCEDDKKTSDGNYYSSDPLETIAQLTLCLSSKSARIEQLEIENKRFLEIKTEKEIAESDLKKVKQELLDVKVEHNKLKMLYNNDILDNYEKSLREANHKLSEAKEELEKNQEVHRGELENVSVSLFLKKHNVLVTAKLSILIDPIYRLRKSCS
jgi:chromosome segregation ATPase